MTYKIAILGASGYTGAELVRLIATHPMMKIVSLSGDRKAGMAMAEVFPFLRHLDLPSLLLTRLLPGTREQPETSAPEGPRDAVVAQLLECAGFAAHADLRCVRNPKRAAVLNGLGQVSTSCYVNDDIATVDAAPHDWTQLQVEFS